MNSLLAALIFSIIYLFTSGFLFQVEASIHYKCPVSFFRAGNQCYFLSRDEATWRDAHFKCLDMNGTLAVPDKKMEDKNLRFKLNRRRNELKERWIGGTYDWGRHFWVWGETGRRLKYQAFSRREPHEQYHWKCIVMNPQYRNRWSARSCLDLKHYICETGIQEVEVQFNYGTAVTKRPTTGARRKRRYKCPERFFLAGNYCYHVSKERSNWRDANFKCKEMNGSELVVLDKKSDDTNLRNALLVRRRAVEESWIGGIYDWNRDLWMWGPTGCTIWHQDFIKNKTEVNEIKDDKQWHCTVMDPKIKYGWASRSCFDIKPFICEKEPERLESPARRVSGRLRALPSWSRHDRYHKRCDPDNNTY